MQFVLVFYGGLYRSLFWRFLCLSKAISNQDSVTKSTLSEEFEVRLIQALEQDDIISFKTFGKVLGSLNSAFSLKKSGEYELFTQKYF
ncbi:hypothetical protein SPPR111872_18245 [Sphingobacterium prati]